LEINFGADIENTGIIVCMC